MTYNHHFPYLDIEPLSLADDYKSHLNRNGIVLINTPSDFSNKEYIDLMSELGNPLAESSLVEGEYVEDKFILNVKTNVERNITMENEPFSINGLRMHVERAFSKQTTQPNYLALFCIVSPDEKNGGQTIVYAMKNLVSYFSKYELDVMKMLYPLSADGKIASVNPIYAFDEGRNLHYFSYRDLGHYGMDWFLKLSSKNDNGVIEIVNKLEKYLYLPDNIKALRWRQGFLYVFDNKKNFHARTEQIKGSKRHLKRIRVI